uniref:RRM domain-containing protein n=1 Tax=Romanomermis culicivorax TaxID=13658 RepID=A0A915HUX4_ROMCU
MRNRLSVAKSKGNVLDLGKNNPKQIHSLGDSTLPEEKMATNEMSNIVYLGRIPEGFVEKDMMSYFKQFGLVKRLKLYRSQKTGRSKGFAFIEFANAEVAKVVASTMNNYLMFERILKCHVLPKDKVHKKLFIKWNEIPQPEARKRRIITKSVGFRSDKQHARMLKRLAKHITQQNAKLQAFGIDYNFPVTWVDKKPKVDMKEELSDIDDYANYSNVNESQNLQSEYSMLIDSSDDEISFQTPEHCVKKCRKLNKSAHVKEVAKVINDAI